MRYCKVTNLNYWSYGMIWRVANDEHNIMQGFATYADEKAIRIRAPSDTRCYHHWFMDKGSRTEYEVL
jgi:hypothetical protein